LNVETVVTKKDVAERPLKFYLFYEWRGIGSAISARSYLLCREILAASWSEAEREAKQLIEAIEPKDNPIKWAYLVEADLGKTLREDE